MIKKGYSLEKCLELGDKFISENKKCLMAFDVKGFSKMKSPEKTEILIEMVKDLNKTFFKYLPLNKLRTYQLDKGFVIIRGDSAIGCINSINGISEIINYQSKKYPNFPLYWIVAKDGWDDKNFKYLGI